ncbi:MAG: HEAT repeat domain-containing protein [bacterium]
MKRLVCALLAVAVACGAASAHVVYERRTLRQWTEQAQIIVVAEVRSELRVWSATDGSDHQEYFSVRVIELLVGDPGARDLDVFAHAEGEPRLRVGDTMLLFLDPTGERAEFRSLTARFPYFTTQGAGSEWSFVRGDSTIPSAARALIALRAGGGTYAARRTLLIQQLKAGDSRLRANAVSELVRLRLTSEFRADREGREELVKLTRSKDLSISRRVALIKILEGSENFSAARSLLDLAGSDIDPGERITIIRASGHMRDPAVTAWLEEQIRSPELEIKLAALTAAGAASHPELLQLVAELAVDPEQRVSRAAVRALAAMDTPAAIVLLQRVAASGSAAGDFAAAALRRSARAQ